jgi:hypothetical protein|tara:strand:+ start:4395 stop:4673 length:279 start_codon:yes stop_codon:yes gene_type:complete
MDEAELLMAEVRLGLQTKEFLNSPLGKYISGRAMKSKEEALESMMIIDPNDTETIRELQFRARLPSIVFIWLDEAINQAKHAEESLQEIQES